MLSPLLEDLVGKLVVRDPMSLTPPNDKDTVFANEKGKIPWAKQKKLGENASSGDELRKATKASNQALGPTMGDAQKPNTPTSKRITPTNILTPAFSVATSYSQKTFSKYEKRACPRMLIKAFIFLM